MGFTNPIYPLANGGVIFDKFNIDYTRHNKTTLHLHSLARYFRPFGLPLGLCFCEQSGGMTKTNLPIRFKPAWAGKIKKATE